MKVPYKRTLTLQAPALATDVDGSMVIGSAPFDGEITSVEYIPNAAITGAATNNRRVAVTNRGQDGAGTTEAAALAFASGVNGVKWDAKTITLSEVEGATGVVAGDVLTFDSTAPGTGIADPGGLVIVTITRDAD